MKSSACLNICRFARVLLWTGRKRVHSCVRTVPFHSETWGAQSQRAGQELLSPPPDHRKAHVLFSSPVLSCIWSLVPLLLFQWICAPYVYVFRPHSIASNKTTTVTNWWKFNTTIMLCSTIFHARGRSISTGAWDTCGTSADEGRQRNSLWENMVKIKTAFLKDFSTDLQKVKGLLSGAQGIPAQWEDEGHISLLLNIPHSSLISK